MVNLDLQIIKDANKNWRSCTKILMIILYVIGFVFTCLSQKGVSPLSPASQAPATGNTFAVIVGISDYHDVNMPDLNYADKDAMAFAEWLQSKAGENLDEDHLMLLTNEKATRAQFDAALTWLLDNCKEGDKAYIYFSGHGDVESRTIGNLGFLLCYDSPPTNYASGAFHLYYLQSVIATLTSKKVKTLVIADACHAGKLAGSSFGGPQATAAELAKQLGNEIKILSCQANETSIEGKQWGGGRGVFSYYLINGLYGFADANEDGWLKLMELSRFVQDHVNRDVDPISQVPIIIGNLNENIAQVDKEIYIKQAQLILNQSKQLSVIDTRGIEEQTLAAVDSQTKVNYYAFKNCLHINQYFCTADVDSTCADSLYNLLSKHPGMAPLHASMRRNYAASLQDVIQRALNALLADDPYEFNNWYINPNKYSEYPKYLQRAIELIGKDHYSYPLLFSQQKYFEAYYLVHSVLVSDQLKVDRDSVLLNAKNLLLEALLYSPNAAFIYQAIGNLYLDKNQYKADSVIKYCEKAIELAPTWLMTYHDLVEVYMNVLVQIDSTESLIQKSLSFKPESYLLNLLLSWVRQKQNRFQEADSICLKLIEINPKLFNALSTMAQTHATIMDWDRVIELMEESFKLESPDKNWARQWYVKALLAQNKLELALQFYSNYSNTQFRNNGVEQIFFAEYYLIHGNYELAMEFIEQVINSYSALNIIADAKVFKARILIQHKRYHDARICLQDAISSDPTPDAADHVARCWLAKLEELEGNYERADSLFQDAFNYPKNIKWGQDIGYFMYGEFLLKQNKDEEAYRNYMESIKLVPFNYDPHFGVAKYYAKKGNSKKALDWIEKALNCYYPIPEPILTEPLFDKIRRTKRFKSCMKKHFEEKL
ncbi:MAG: hypothetical protein WBO44_10490 [Saprospiraceae bacterium]